MATEMLHVRVDAALKAEASAVLAGLDLSTSDAIRLFLRRVVADRALPGAFEQSGSVREARAGFTMAVAIEELESVRLRASVATVDGELPPGSRGTIVHRYPTGEAYEVEFLTPLAAVLTLRAGDIERA